MKKLTKILIILGLTAITLNIAYLTTAVFNTQKYSGATKEQELIPRLQSEGYTFLTPTEYFNQPTPNKTAIIIHDADFTIKGLESFIQIEKSFNVKSAFYPRPNTDWFSQSIPLLQQAETEGFEIGFQYDCLSRANNNTTFAVQLFQAQLKYMRAFLNISTTTYHGDNFNLSINNLNLYQNNKDLWKTLELNETYSIQNYSYITDTNAEYKEPKELTNLVLIQLHTDWAQ
jgi:hypothetical protein